jgi:hypothetical protein
MREGFARISRSKGVAVEPPLFLVLGFQQCRITGIMFGLEWGMASSELRNFISTLPPAVFDWSPLVRGASGYSAQCFELVVNGPGGRDA